MILLDTSTLVDLFRKKDKQKTFFYKIAQNYSDFAISTITKYEILIGSNIIQDEFWNNFFETVRILPFDNATVQEAVKIYKTLIANNKLINLPDIFIAATAIANKIPIATLNVKHFERIKAIEIIR